MKNAFLRMQRKNFEAWYQECFYTSNKPMAGFVFEVDTWEGGSYFILGVLVVDPNLYTQVTEGYSVQLSLPNNPSLTTYDGTFGWWETEYVLVERGTYDDGITVYSYFILVGLGVPNGTEFSCLSGGIRFNGVFPWA